ncbi:MAG: hypothetical protein FGM54_05485 [Chitinophagaceae bacterium]|nr:hypothetical protein [Chitinophagaceae bacterium]
MKQIFLFVSVFLAGVFFVACESNQADQVSQSKSTTFPDMTLRRTADSVMQLLKGKNLANLKTFIAPKTTVLFSPYSYVDTNTAMRLSVNDLNDMFTDTIRVNWGTYDGSGLPIQLSCGNYYNTFIYNHPFAEADSVFENKSIQRGNSIDNLSVVFPGNEHVEYFVAGDPKNAGLGWGSLTLVFRKEGNRYFLVGVVNNRWTI